MVGQLRPNRKARQPDRPQRAAHSSVLRTGAVGKTAPARPASPTRDALARLLELPAIALGLFPGPRKSSSAALARGGRCPRWTHYTIARGSVHRSSDDHAIALGSWRRKRRGRLECGWRGSFGHGNHPQQGPGNLVSLVPGCQFHLEIKPGLCASGSGRRKKSNRDRRRMLEPVYSSRRRGSCSCGGRLRGQHGNRRNPSPIPRPEQHPGP